MQKGVPGNTDHTFTVDVYDSVWDLKVESTVTVTIQDISEEAVFSSGSVRLKGTQLVLGVAVYIYCIPYLT